MFSFKSWPFLTILRNLKSLVKTLPKVDRMIRAAIMPGCIDFEGVFICFLLADSALLLVCRIKTKVINAPTTFRHPDVTAVEQNKFVVSSKNLEGNRKITNDEFLSQCVNRFSIYHIHFIKSYNIIKKPLSFSSRSNLLEVTNKRHK